MRVEYRHAGRIDGHAGGIIFFPCGWNIYTCGWNYFFSCGWNYFFFASILGPRLRAVQPSGSTSLHFLNFYYIFYYYKLIYSPIPLRYAGRREMFSEKKNPLPFRTDGKVKLSRPKRVENGTSPPLPPAPGDSPGPFNDRLYKNKTTSKTTG